MELVRVAKHQDDRVASQEHLVDNAILHNRLALCATSGILSPNFLDILQNPAKRGLWDRPLKIATTRHH